MRWGRASYPRRSRSSRACMLRRAKCSRSAWRISSDRFNFFRFAAVSAAFKRFASRTTCIVCIVGFYPQHIPHRPACFGSLKHRAWGSAQAGHTIPVADPLPASKRQGAGGSGEPGSTLPPRKRPAHTRSVRRAVLGPGRLFRLWCKSVGWSRMADWPVLPRSRNCS